MGDTKRSGRRSLWRREQDGGRYKRVNGALAPFGAVYLALLGLGIVAALTVYLLLVTFVPGASSSRLDAMKTALLVVAGSGAGAGLYVQYRKQQTDEVKSALDHANSRRDQDKLFTERYTTAVAQLGSQAAAVRLGGVYALARIADDSDRDRPTCLKVLCAYLRMPYDPDDSATEPAEREVRTTVQSALAERLRPSSPGFWPEADIDLTGAYLVDLDFQDILVAKFTADRAVFSGRTRFNKATFGMTAHFGAATFTGHTGFDRATFSRDARFIDATFGGVGFLDVKFVGSARFDRARFEMTAYFGRATFSKDAGFDLVRFGGSVGFNGTTFGGNANFGGATFCRNTGFDRVTFSTNAGFNGVTFAGDSGFGGANFGGDAWFNRAVFGGNAEFGDAGFGGVADFTDARFRTDFPPVWPKGFAEPTTIRWEASAPSASASILSPDPTQTPVQPSRRKHD